MTRPLGIAAIVLAANVYAGVVVESGDAGDLPGTAQIISGQPSHIVKFFDAFNDQDMYRIYIPDVSKFSASTDNSGTQLTDNSDVMLYLLDANGFGLFANDDNPFSPGSLKAAFPGGSLSGPPGYYYLAISMFANVPLGPSGEIFPNDPSDAVVQPFAPGSSDSELLGWSFDPFPEQIGNYEIDLTYTPEPSTLTAGLAAVAFILISLPLRRRMHTGSRFRQRGPIHSS
jgi:hypothetical protein